MKKMLIFLLVITCLWSASGCGSENPVTNTSAPASDPSVPASDPNEKEWSVKDITDLFSQVKEPDWEYRDCVLISDHASGRVGAVLFWDNIEKTSNVAFFDAEGYYQQCGIYAKISENPDFQYLGDGAVTFQAESENGTVYDCTITISVEDGSVNFTVADGLSKPQ